jgi:hypothetical protein
VKRLDFRCKKFSLDGWVRAVYELMAGILITILVVAILFAMIYPGGAGIAEGARVGVLIGIFVVCGFVLHNYVNLNIGLKLTAMQAVAYFIQWTIVGTVIGLIYKPLGTP